MKEWGREDRKVVYGKHGRVEGLLGQVRLECVSGSKGIGLQESEVKDAIKGKVSIRCHIRPNDLHMSTGG